MIPLETIEAGWNQFNTADQDVIRRTLKELHRRQPLLMHYLLDPLEKVLDDKEHQMLYFLGAFVVKQMLGAFPRVPEVKEDFLAKVQKLHIEMFGYLATAKTGAELFDLMDDVINANRQAPLLRFVVNTLANDACCRQMVRDENVWVLFVHLKIVLDGLSKAGK